MNIQNIIFILPAYIANAMPVFIGGEIPLDKLLKIKLFGNNKTLLGLLSAFSSGVISAYILSFYSPYNFYLSFTIGLISTIGAIFGDLFGSVIKRKLGKKEGTEFWLDNILFIFFAMLFVNFYYNTFEPDLFLLILLITFFIHKYANVIAHKIGLKKVPW